MPVFRPTRSARLAASSVLALAAAGVLTAGPAVAQVIDNDTVVVDGTTQAYAAPMYIGSDGAGELQILNGGVVTSPSALIGRRAGSFGDVTIDGEDSRWTIDGNLFVGVNGTGLLTIRNGGQLITGGGGAATEVGSYGTVIVTGPGSRWDSFFPSGVGIRGFGTLDVSRGGVVTASSLVAGSAAGAQGTVHLSGADSRYIAEESVLLGIYGSGTLTISEGAVAEAPVLILGQYASGRGTLNIGRAAGSVAKAAGTINTSSIAFGAGGGSIVLNHTDDGYELDETITGAGTIRVLAGRTILSGDNTYTGSTLLEGGTLTLASNAALGGSTLRTTGSVVDYADGVEIANPVVIDSNTTQFQVLTGSATQSGAITEANGARPFLKVGAGELILTGDNTWSRETTVREGALTFDGGSLTNSSLLYVEQANVIVRGGGTLRSSYGYVGRGAAGAGALTVSGAGSRWINTGSIELGLTSGGTLTISDGGQVESLNLHAGYNSAPGIVNVSGENSRLTIDQFYVGNAAEGFVTISGGGQVFAQRSFINYVMGTGAATVTGDGSLLASADRLFIGGLREGVLTLTDGGVARVEDGDGLANLASGAYATGTLNIGAASGEGPARAGILEAAELAFGDGAGTLSFNHTDEGYVFAPRLTGAGTILHHAGETILSADNSGFSGDYSVQGGRLILEGANGQAADPMTPGSGSILGAEGEDAPEVLIRNGGTFTGRVLSADGSGEGMGLIRIAGALSSAEVEEAYAGTMGAGRIELIDGARLTAGDAWLGYYGEGFLSVRDGASAEFGVLTAGLYGQSSIEITGGGQVDTAFFEGAQSWAASTDVMVSGAGSMLSVDNSLVLAREGRGSLSILDGGNVITSRLLMAGGEESEAEVTVSGGGSQLVSIFDLGVGVENGGRGVLTVEDGGMVQAGGLGVGFGAGTTGEVVVRGVESRLAAMEAAIGYEGAGSLLLTEGGALTVMDGSGSVYVGLEAGSTGVLAIGALEGEAAAQAGYLSADGLIFGAGNGSLVFNHTNTSYIFQPGMSGVGEIQHLAGQTWMVGDNTGFTGQTAIEGGEMAILTNLGGDVLVSGGVLRGSGSILGTVSVTGGVLAGETGQTLTMGSLFLGAGARTNVTLDGAGELFDPERALFNVTGDLTLDGVLNVTEGADFGVGVYRLFDYGGVLTDNGMTIDMAPTGYTADDLAIQTAVAGQVNLAVSLNDLRFWDGDPENAGNGAIDGGDGVWSLSGANWTDMDGLQNGANRPAPSLAVFMGAAGVVTVDDSDGDIAATGLQFASDGYVLTGDGLLLTQADGNAPVIRVGDGTAAGAGISARIDLDLTTFGALTKTDLGSLIMTGDNVLDGLRVRHGGLTLAQGLTRSGDLEAGVQSGDDGRLLVTDAARLNSTGAVLGQIAETRGEATVSGADSAWTVDGTLFVGAGGEGRLTIENEGLVDVGTAVIASEIGGAGAAVVTGEGSLWNVTSGLFVGGYSDGVLTVENGGWVSALYGAVGTYAGADGLAVVSGEGSLLELGDYLIVGAADDSRGNVVLTDGGLLTAGELILAESAGARGVLAIGALAGSDAAAGGVLQAGQVRFGDGAGELVFNHTEADYGFAAAMSGAGGLRQMAGATRLTADSSGFTGNTTVTGGALLVDGVLGGDVSVTGGSLGGSGSVLGTATIADGGVLSGAQGRTLGLGTLVLSEGSVVSAALGAADGAAALFDVAGDLTLDGELEVTDVGGFGAGVYRLFDYGGALTDLGLDIASAPDGVDLDDLYVQTSVANQVNLVSTYEVDLRFWDSMASTDDGAIQGGGGIWSLTGRDWTGEDGAVNGAYDNPAFAVFMGTGGAVTVDGSGTGVTGMQFAVDGYALTGDGIELTEDQTLIRVGDGTAAGAAMTATIGSSLTGAGALVKTDLGTLILTGTNSYQGGTVVRAGVLIGDTGSLIGDVVNDAVLVFDQATDAAFAGDITGDGETIKRGDGVLSLLGANAMDWVVETGGLLGQAGAFSGDVDIASGANFTLNADANAVFSGVLSGDGTFAKTGAGGLALTGDSSDFAGITEIRDGLLLVNGALGGELRLFDGAMLGGSGALGQLTAGDGSVIAPGNSIGTLNITGDVVFDAGSIYEVEVDPTSDASDRIVAGGTATLNGGVVRHIGLTGEYRPEATYTILTAVGGVTGAFDAIETDFAFLDASLTYQTNAVLMTLERNAIPFPAVGESVNQRATAAAVEASESGDPLYDAVVGLNAGNARLAFDMLSGELHGSIRTAQSEAAQVLAGTLTGRMDAAGSIGTGAAFWAQAVGSRTRMATDGNAASLTQGSTGLMMGADAGFGAVRLGVAAGASIHDYDSAARAGSAEADSLSLAAYGSGQWGALGLKGAVSGTWHEVETERLGVFPGFAEVLTADYDAETVHAFVEASWRVDMGPATTLEPFVNIARVRTESDGFTEAGGDAALTVQGRVQTANLATVGVGMNHAFDQGDGRTAVLSGRLGWRHARDGTAADGRHAFADSPTPAFTVHGLPITKDAVVAELGLDLDLKDRLSLTVDWSGQLASGLDANALAATLNWRF
ncbi:MAG: autotransporter domain-containing protein [Alphaproteobacteria bacterium]|nr:autotransporter domain-containing protein [Alphaproteobacteria bacterium]MBU2270656.1 autotransporter domain-containing protein [Alphaproteobacteria bacterium]MBU2419093.1 autotransporter domain-containing protein [Alphaproteobacteria bacterium]